MRSWETILKKHFSSWFWITNQGIPISFDKYSTDLSISSHYVLSICLVWMMIDFLKPKKANPLSLWHDKLEMHSTIMVALSPLGIKDILVWFQFLGMFKLQDRLSDIIINYIPASLENPCNIFIRSRTPMIVNGEKSPLHIFPKERSLRKVVVLGKHSYPY